MISTVVPYFLTAIQPALAKIISMLFWFNVHTQASGSRFHRVQRTCVRRKLLLCVNLWYGSVVVFKQDRLNQAASAHARQRSRLSIRQNYFGKCLLSVRIREPLLGLWELLFGFGVGKS